MSDQENMTPEPDESAPADALALDKETLKDLEPSESDQEGAQGGMREVSNQTCAIRCQSVFSVRSQPAVSDTCGRLEVGPQSDV
jgi:hypothetical protein